MSAIESVPLKILHEAVGLIVTAEVDGGSTFRGTLKAVEDSMNIELENVVYTDPRGRTQERLSVYLRGSNITFFALPDAVKHSPGFTSLETGAPHGNGRAFGGDRQKRARE